MTPYPGRRCTKPTYFDEKVCIHHQKLGSPPLEWEKCPKCRWNLKPVQEELCGYCRVRFRGENKEKTAA